SIEVSRLPLRRRVASFKAFLDLAGTAKVVLIFASPFTQAIFFLVEPVAVLTKLMSARSEHALEMRPVSIFRPQSRPLQSRRLSRVVRVELAVPAQRIKLVERSERVVDAAPFLRDFPEPLVDLAQLLGEPVDVVIQQLQKVFEPLVFFFLFPLFGAVALPGG